MAVTLTNSLPRIAFSRNPIWLKLQSDAYLASAGVTAISSLKFTGAAVADQALSLKWGSVAVNLVAKAAPDSSGTQIPTGDGSAAYMQSLVPILDSNFLINRDFITSWDATSGTILFTAREFGTAYNFTASTVGTAQVAKVRDGSAKELKTNFGIHLEVWIQKANDTNFEQCYNYNVELDYPLTGMATVDISDALHSFLTIDQPNITGSVFQACPNSVRKYYIKYAEYYGDKPEVKKVTTSAQATVLLGGFSNMALRAIPDISTYVEKMLLPDPALFRFQRWLETYQIDTFNVKTNEVRYLYFVNNRDVAETLKLMITINFDSGAPTTKTVAGLAVQPLQKIAVACGYRQLGLDAYTSATRKVVSYQVQLVENATSDPRSLVKTFNVDRSYEAWTRYFLFLDSAGNFKTLRTYGKSALTAEISRDLAIKESDAGSLPVNGNYENYNISSIQSDEVNSGYISDSEEYDNLNDLMHSAKVFRVIGDDLIPVIITGKKFQYAADGETLHGWKIEYQLAFEEELYTGDSAALDVPKLNRSQQALNEI